MISLYIILYLNSIYIIELWLWRSAWHWRVEADLYSSVTLSTGAELNWRVHVLSHGLECQEQFSMIIDECFHDL